MINLMFYRPVKQRSGFSNTPHNTILSGASALRAPTFEFTVESRRTASIRRAVHHPDFKWRCHSIQIGFSWTDFCRFDASAHAASRLC